ncbi:hypothetical protein IW252_002427 [Zhihengliuella flava]|uniref:Uncharacterized protein n=1 Tax=Zhihengliuella flava TaxID=1285193 RepID=A0A931D8L9_9MICC|nr:hypothetical protein [Zhihengliuella flava]
MPTWLSGVLRKNLQRRLTTVGAINEVYAPRASGAEGSRVTHDFDAPV